MIAKTRKQEYKLARIRPDIYKLCEKANIKHMSKTGERVGLTDFINLKLQEGLQHE